MKNSDSPWFWAYLFGMSALILGWIAAPSWVARQSRHEQRHLQGSGAIQQQPGESTEATEGDSLVNREDVSSPEARSSRSSPTFGAAQQEATARAVSRWRQLLGVLGIGVTISWIGWLLHRRR